ncbi:MAG: winged helix-turn-helix domain-containing protein [Dysgonamonadaceae bacterium]|jgi:restriction system protein|nr:winged helix-turn-helix domain-containing protein [Dysgonamonadaceae bacterium]
METIYNDAVDILAKKYNVTEEEKRELLPSGRTFVFVSRVSWARTYLKKAGLKQKPKEINIAFLKQYPEFLEFQNFRNKPLKLS